MNEKKKMTAGKIYDPFTEPLIEERHRAHELCRQYNTLDEKDPVREKILDILIPQNNGVYLQGPIQFDYGFLTTFGKGCYANFNFTVLDCCEVKIGDNVFFGPNVSLVTPVHPFLPEERNPYVREDGETTDMEYAKPITIGDNCWFATNVTVVGGVTVGEGCVIGAGSVVTRDIPPHSFAAGVPCRVIREISPEDSIKLKKELW